MAGLVKRTGLRCLAQRRAEGQIENWTVVLIFKRWIMEIERLKAAKLGEIQRF